MATRRNSVAASQAAPESTDGLPADPEARALFERFRFERLPVEGTYFSGTWRSREGAPGGGPAGTAILGLYCHEPASLSLFHRLAYDEVWHAYAGDPFILALIHPDGRWEEVLMGTGVLEGQSCQFVVPAGTWQAGCLVPEGRFALYGCTMAPGYTENCFEPGYIAGLLRLCPRHEAEIRRLAVDGPMGQAFR